MEDMRKCVTADNERKYGLWEIKDDKTAVRKCTCCGINFDRPITKGILNQIKKQYEAIPLLENFLVLSVDDPNFIGYLNVILEDVVDYIDDDRKRLLDKKLIELNTTNFISEENKIMLENFRKAIKSNDNDLFFDTMEYFKVYNIDSLNNFISIDKSFSK